MVRLSTALHLIRFQLNGEAKIISVTVVNGTVYNGGSKRGIGNMARLPQPGGDAGNWGEILNNFLRVMMREDGRLKNDSIQEANLAPGIRAKLSASSASARGVRRSSDYAAASGDFVIGDTSGGAFTVTLPPPANGAAISVKKVDDSVNAIIVMRSGIQIDGENSVVVNSQWQSQDFFSDGTGWYRV